MFVVLPYELQVDVPLEESDVRVVLQEVEDAFLGGVERRHVGGDHAQVGHLSEIEDDAILRVVFV